MCKIQLELCKLGVKAWNRICLKFQSWSHPKKKIYSWLDGHVVLASTNHTFPAKNPYLGVLQWQIVQLVMSCLKSMSIWWISHLESSEKTHNINHGSHFLQNIPIYTWPSSNHQKVIKLGKIGQSLMWCLKSMSIWWTSELEPPGLLIIRVIAAIFFSPSPKCAEIHINSIELKCWPIIGTNTPIGHVVLEAHGIKIKVGASHRLIITAMAAILFYHHKTPYFLQISLTKYIMGTNYSICHGMLKVSVHIMNLRVGATRKSHCYSHASHFVLQSLKHTNIHMPFIGHTKRYKLYISVNHGHA